MRRHFMKTGGGDKEPLIWYSPAKQDPAVTDRLIDLTGNGFDMTLHGTTVASNGVAFYYWNPGAYCPKPFVLNDFTIICRVAGIGAIDYGKHQTNAIVAKGLFTLRHNYLFTDTGGIRLGSPRDTEMTCYVHGAYTKVDSTFPSSGTFVMTNEAYYLYGSGGRVKLAQGDDGDRAEYKLGLNPGKDDSSLSGINFRLQDLLIFDRKLTEEEVAEVVETMINS